MIQPAWRKYAFT